MSKLAPRNANVMIVKESDGRTYVRKRYLAVYTAVQERAAYDRLRPLCGPIRGIKMARVLAVDEKNNSLRLEYVPGKSLYETVEMGDIGPLIEWREPLVELFTAARTRGIRFDGDPSNFIVHAETGQLVIIDPVCVDLQIEDFAMVVFLWGFDATQSEALAIYSLNPGLVCVFSGISAMFRRGSSRVQPPDGLLH